MSSVPNLFVFRADSVRRCTALLPFWPKAVIGSQERSRYLWHVFAFDGEPYAGMPLKYIIRRRFS